MLQLEPQNGPGVKVPGISVNKVYNMFAVERYMGFKFLGELLPRKKWEESLTPGNKFRFLNCSRVENLFFEIPFSLTPKIFARILRGEGGI